MRRSLIGSLRATPPALRCVAAPRARTLCYVPPSETPEGKRRKRNFWAKWGGLSQQEFWQDVGFDQDRKKDSIRIGMGSKQKGMKAKPEVRGVDLDDDEYFLADDALTLAEGDGDEYLWLDGETALRTGSAVPESGSRSGAERAKRARAALLAQPDVEPARRAELLELLEDLGPEGLLPPPSMPPLEDFAEGLNSEELFKEDLARNLQIARSFHDSLKLRESGGLPDGQYFGYMLNNRRVSKSMSETKRGSYSTLVVVGNGQGTAGIGMGKDVVAGNALYKATVAARKNLVYIERFDQRTMFHAFDERFARTKLVMRLRRPGSGTRCSWVVWKLLSAFGISDVSVKIHGSRNPTTVAYALVNALQRCSSAQAVADRRGLRILDMSPDEIRVPGY